MKTVPSPQTSWFVSIAEAGSASGHPSAPRKSRVGFWITSEFRHARLRWRRPSSSNFPSPSNDHGQLKLRIGVSPSCCITPSHRAYFHPPPEKLRQTWAALAPSKHKLQLCDVATHPADGRRIRAAWRLKSLSLQPIRPSPDGGGAAPRPCRKEPIRPLDDRHLPVHAVAGRLPGRTHRPGRPRILR